MIVHNRVHTHVPSRLPIGSLRVKTLSKPRGREIYKEEATACSWRPRRRQFEQHTPAHRAAQQNKMVRATALASLLAMTSAGFNDPVVRKSLPHEIDGSSIRFTDTTHTSATIHWEAPDLGDWQWPILGYRIQITSTFGWTEVAGAVTPGATEPISYSNDALDFTVCPDAMELLGTCSGGFLTSEYGTDTDHVLPGLEPDTSYYFRVLAYNHDGDAEWSGSSYELRTHGVPKAVAAPVVASVTKGSITIEWTTAITTGTDECTSTASRDLTSETCFSFTDCMRTSSETCQAVGTGSPATKYRIQTSTDGGTNFEEIVDANTGLSLYDQMTIPTGADGDLTILTETSGTYSYPITALAPATEYCYKVAATNAAGEGDFSAPVCASTLGVPLTPKPPTATAVTATSITLTWNILKGYCPDSNVPLSSPAYTNKYNAYPAKATRTTDCLFDGAVPLTGFRIFGSSYNPTANDGDYSGSVHNDGTMYSLEYQQTGGDSTLETSSIGDWEPARRGSLTSDTTDSTYWSSPLSKALPAGLDSGKWLELSVDEDSRAAGSYVVEHLAQDTYYKFKILFNNEVGDSAFSDDSEFFLTLEAPVTALKMHSQPPCIYEDGRATRFVATSSGTNVFYKWQLSDGIQYNSHDTRNYGSVIAEGESTACVTSDCSVMEFVLPSISTQDGPSEENSFTIAVVGYNTRGQTVLETTYNVQYCGCTDPWDGNYWDQATYHMPLMCEYEGWTGADKTVIAGEFQYYQLYYHEATHSAQVIVRVDEGSVDLFTSTLQIPDPAMNTTFQRTFSAISSFHILEIPYADLADSRKLYIAVRGVDTFSRFEVISSTREFTRGRGELTTGGETTDGSQDYTRTQLLNIEPQSLEIKTPYYAFFEYYFAKASNDVDVEVKVNALLGCVNVYTSKVERFPSPLRASEDYLAGYWTNHNNADSLCATGADAVTTSYKRATASFDGVGGVYGSITFRQEGADDALVISVSLKGMVATHDLPWNIHEHAVGGSNTDPSDDNSYGCASTGGLFQPMGSDSAAAMSAKHGNFPYVTDGLAAPYTTTITDSDLTLFGESIASAEEGIGGGDVSAQSILGRSVVITKPCTANGLPEAGDDNPCQDGTSEVTICATIYASTMESTAVGELRLMHTIKPEEDRLLYVSVQGADTYALSEEQANNEYVIEAKIYRYRIDSNLLQPVNGTSCYTDSANGVSCRSDSEDQRYSVVTIDNFNYYEVDLSDSAYGLTVHFTLAYGSVVLYTSENKLPTQDEIGHEHRFGAADTIDTDVPCATGACFKEVDDSKIAALTQGEQFELGTTYHINIPFASINVAEKYIFVGVLGTSPDSSYTISITEYVFDGIMTPLTSGTPSVVSVAAGTYSFFTLYVGPEDEAMSTTYRSGAGARTSNLGTDVSTWGIDWTEPLTQTWVEQQQDEWDLDVDVNVNDVESTHDVMVYGSMSQPYPSEERGYHVKNFNCDQDELGVDGLTASGCVASEEVIGSDASCGATESTADETSCTGVTELADDVACIAADDNCEYTAAVVEVAAVVCGPRCVSGPVVIPHFTFSDKMVYISVWSPTTQDVTLTVTIHEMHQNALSLDAPTTVPECPGETKDGDGVVTSVCSGHGSCVDATCFCDSKFLGEACEIEAFSIASGQPSLIIPTRDFLEPVGGSSVTPFPGNKAVEVPFTLSSIPPGSKVHIYVDGLPYPAKGANIKYYTHETGTPDFAEMVSVYGMSAGVIHTVELLLLSEKNIPLATDTRDFTVDFHGGCSGEREQRAPATCTGVVGTASEDEAAACTGVTELDDGTVCVATANCEYTESSVTSEATTTSCSDKGVCHHGYCVCFDGFAGVACEIESSDEDFTEALAAAEFKPGDGYVQYNENLMNMTRLKDKYASSLKMAANTQFLELSDAKIKTAHDSVVSKLDQFIVDNAAKMSELADTQEKASEALFRKRDRITTTLQQMREETRRLKTHNQEAYLATVRLLHDGQREMQNKLDLKRRDHFISMAKEHDRWIELKAKNDFKLNQLRTANGPLVDIDALQERQCTQDDMFHTSCTNVAADAKFVTQPGYMSHQTVNTIGTCTEDEEGQNTVVSGPDGDGPYTQRCVKGVLVRIDGEYHDDMYINIPR